MRRSHGGSHTVPINQEKKEPVMRVPNMYEGWRLGGESHLLSYVVTNIERCANHLMRLKLWTYSLVLMSSDNLMYENLHISWQVASSLCNFILKVKVL